MVYVRARGTRFHVVDLGEDVPGVTPVVMLHGLFTGSAASWYFTAAPAIARLRPVRLIDWRGHGLSDRTDTGYDSATMVADLTELTCDLAPFAVVGHSFGAVVAVRFALARPQRVRRIALVDPPFVLPGRARLPWLRAPRAVPDLAELIGHRTRGTRLLMERTSVLADLEAEPPVTEDDLRGLAGIPLMSVVGSRSPFRGGAELVSRALPEARCRVLGGGHDLHITAKGRLVPLLADFLCRQKDRSDG
jgi:pimeloyl-ACP methyl ester carboxylesterase